MSKGTIMKTSNTVVSIVNLSNKAEAAKVSPIVLEKVLDVVGNSVEGLAAVQLMEGLRETMKDFRFSYLIAGGVYRDTLVGAEVKDVDIFIYDIEPKQFKEIGKEVATMQGGIVDTSGGFGYESDAMTSVRVGDYNLIHKAGAYNTGKTLLKDFSADVSMIGVDYCAFPYGEPQILINPKGMANLLINKEIEFFLNSAYMTSRDYVAKISAKSWAKGYTLTHKGKFFDESISNPEGGLKLDDVNYMMSDVVKICMNVEGLFEQSYTALTSLHASEKRIFRECNLEFSSTSNPFDITSEGTHIAIWSDYFREGVNHYDLTSKLLWMAERFNGEVNMAWHLEKEDTGFGGVIVKSIDSVFNESVGTWTKAEMELVTEKSYLKGWDCILVNNNLNHEVAFDLWTSGKKRLVLKECTRKEVMLSAYGLSGKVDPLVSKNTSQGFGANYNLTSRLKTALESCKSVKPRDIDAVKTYSELAETLSWYSVLGVSFKLLDLNMRSHSRLAETYCFGPIPVKFQPQIAKSKLLCAWIFESSLDIDNLAGWNFKTAKECVLASIALAYAHLDVDVEKVFESPTLLDVYAYVQENPSESVDHNFPDINIRSGDLTLELLPKSDLINLYIGDLTSCCQKLGGVGSKVCTEGWNDPNSVNYVFRLPSGRIVAHMWVWRDAEGNYVIDSIEGKSFSNTTDISELVLQFSQTVDKTVYVSNTHYGVTGAVHANLHGGMETVECLESITDYTYMDASPGSSILKLGKGCINLAIESNTFEGYEDDNFDNIPF